MAPAGNPRVKVGVYGGRSMTGVELLRLLERHPGVEVSFVASGGAAGSRLDEFEPGAPPYTLAAPEDCPLEDVELAFLCTGHGKAAAQTKACLDAGVRVVDLSGDHRLRDPALHERTYGSERDAAAASEAFYGLPELGRDGLKDARLVANPGCYPTAVSVGLAPLARRGWLKGSVLVDAKSGISGAGRSPNEKNAFCSVHDDVRPYASGRGHRHVPEMEQALADAGAEPGSFQVVFVPQLVPAERGILANLYVHLEPSALEGARAAYEEDYAQEAFVELLPAGKEARMRAVRGGNRVQLALHPVPDAGLLVVTAAIDNLVKGAAGQAIQNMNRMLGLAEPVGLPGVAPASMGGEA